MTVFTSSPPPVPLNQTPKWEPTCSPHPHGQESPGSVLALGIQLHKTLKRAGEQDTRKLTLSDFNTSNCSKTYCGNSDQNRGFFPSDIKMQLPSPERGLWAPPPRGTRYTSTELMWSERDSTSCWEIMQLKAKDKIKENKSSICL